MPDLNPISRVADALRHAAGFASSPNAHRLGVCSWSLRPTGSLDLAALVHRVGVKHIQLHLDPIRESKPDWGEIQTLQVLRRAGIDIVSGMMSMLNEDYSSLDSIAKSGGVRPDSTWPANLAAARANARLARRLNIPLVTFHAGFIPHDPGAERSKMIDRLRQLVDAFDDSGVRVAFETGQESAETLLDALRELERPHAGVNFDPANMILYGMGNPVAALELLAPRITQIHIKDAVPAATAGQWGDEVPAGTGAVDWTRFFQAIAHRGIGCDLLIEREAGDKRVDDAIVARKLVEEHLRA